MLYGEPSVSSLLPVLCEKKINRVFLFPLFLSPASHVTRDIASESAPLRSAFTAAGIRTEMLGHGLLESSEMRTAIGALCLKRMERFYDAEACQKAEKP